MVRARRDNLTLELLDYVPVEPVERFEEISVRACKLSARVSKAVSNALKDSGKSRAEIATEMSDYLGEAVTENMLNRYASESSVEHAIPAHRLIGLAVVTSDFRLLNALVEPADAVAVPRRYEHLIRREEAKARIAELEQLAETADAAWKAGRPRK